MNVVRWGIIGCGDVTEVKSGPALQKADGSQLVAVMRRNGALAQDYARRHGVPRWYDDAQQLIDDPEVDAVYIATPPHMHKEYTLAVARAGKPAYVEKPMALDTAECQQMIDACRSAGVPLFVAYYRRALPRFVKIKEILDSGGLGEIRYVQITLTQPAKPVSAGNLPWRVQPETAGGGLFVDLASHTLDFLDYVLGPITNAQGIARNQGGAYPAEDIVSGSFEFASGVVGNGLWSFNSFASTDQVVISGDRGKLSFATFENEPVVLETEKGSQSFDIPQPPHVQQHLIQQVVDELLGRGCCVSTGENGLRTTRVMETLLSDYYRK
ncbi:MAG TPA: Gfo/Idh/MocA family oxidoreductase [Bellilinea sp.]